MKLLRPGCRVELIGSELYGVVAETDCTVAAPEADCVAGGGSPQARSRSRGTPLYQLHFLHSSELLPYGSLLLTAACSARKVLALPIANLPCGSLLLYVIIVLPSAGN